MGHARPVSDSLEEKTCISMVKGGEAPLLSPTPLYLLQTAFLFVAFKTIPYMQHEYVYNLPND
jgi:hypothetical protein